MIVGPGYAVLVSAKAASWLRKSLRDQPPPHDADVTEVMREISTVAHWFDTRATSGICGSSRDKPAEAAQPSTYVTSSEAATILGLTDRAVRLALAAGRLAGERDAAGHWRIRRADLADYEGRAA